MNGFPPPFEDSAESALDRRLAANWSAVMGEVLASASRRSRACRSTCCGNSGTSMGMDRLDNRGAVVCVLRW
jgi:hypothetical protein